jgi:UDP-GlcNAc:undecaprenyl-phosphate GlcNAc-1-phosphate transferase
MNWHTKQIILFTVIITGIIAMALVPIMIKLAWKLNILDKPDALRKLHSRTTPYLGGAVLWGATISGMAGIYIFLPKAGIQLEEMILLSFPFIIGLLDDKFGLSAIFRLIIQSITVLLLMYYSNLLVLSESIIELSNLFPAFMTFFLGMALINAFNLIDGLDGLTLGLGVLSITALCTLPGWVSISVLGASAAFLGSSTLLAKWNLHPAKIFLGDAGSLFIGGFVFWIFIKQMGVSLGSTTPIFAFLLILPCIDTFAVIIQRLYAKHPIFSADRRHIHHHLRKLKYSHRTTVSMLHFITAFQLSLFWLSWYTSFWTLGITMLCLSNLIFYLTVAYKVSIQQVYQNHKNHQGAYHVNN